MKSTIPLLALSAGFAFAAPALADSCGSNAVICMQVDVGQDSGHYVTMSSNGTTFPGWQSNCVGGDYSHFAMTKSDIDAALGSMNFLKLGSNQIVWTQCSDASCSKASQSNTQTYRFTLAKSGDNYTINGKPTDTWTYTIKPPTGTVCTPDPGNQTKLFDAQ